MADKTGIEWTDATWNPTTGCDKVSPGCDNCYALTQAGRNKAMEIANGRADTGKYQTDGDPKTSGPGFGFAMHATTLDQPIHWKRPRKVFVNSMSDLFHNGMDVEFLADVFAVMSIADQHTFQVLTKRPQIMRSVLTGPITMGPFGRVPSFKFLVDVARMKRGYSVLPDSRRKDGTYAWPLRNVILGTSVEDQKRADLRMPHLLATPAHRRFVSAEPLLGPVDLTAYTEGLHWVIVGGESGPGSRPMAPEWARGLRDQCEEAGVPFLFKQWGSWIGQTSEEHEGHVRERFVPDAYVNIDTGEVVEDGAPQTATGWWSGVHRINKHKAGRLLDGVEHNGYPVMEGV